MFNFWDTNKNCGVSHYDHCHHQPPLTLDFQMGASMNHLLSMPFLTLHPCLDMCIHTRNSTFFPSFQLHQQGKDFSFYILLYYLNYYFNICMYYFYLKNNYVYVFIYFKIFYFSTTVCVWHYFVLVSGVQH